MYITCPMIFGPTAEKNAKSKKTEGIPRKSKWKYCVVEIGNRTDAMVSKSTSIHTMPSIFYHLKQYFGIWLRVFTEYLQLSQISKRSIPALVLHTQRLREKRLSAASISPVSSFILKAFTLLATRLSESSHVLHILHEPIKMIY